MRSLCLLFALTATSAFGECVAGVSIHSGAGWTVFEADVASSEVERSKGLMGKEQMPYGAGMLFLYPDAGSRNFWMKNTPLPLDILFFDQKLKLVSVAKNTTPMSESPIPGGDGIVAVLEINGGLFDELGFDQKTKMKVQGISGDTCPSWIFNDQAFSPQN